MNRLNYTLRTRASQPAVIRSAVLATGLLFAVAAVGQPRLTLRGECPGPMTITGLGLTPNGTASFFKADTRGTDTVPAGPCAGTALGLDSAVRVAVRTADPNGRIEVNPSPGESACGDYLQIVDVATCTVTAVGQISAVQVLASTGDEIDAGTLPLGITSLSSIVVNSGAEWIVGADTDAVDPQTSEILLKNGALLLREGDPLIDLDPDPEFSDRIDRFDAITLNEESRSAFTFCTDGPDMTPDDGCTASFEFDSVVFLDDQLAAAEGRSGGSFVYGSILETKLNKNEQMLVAANLGAPLGDRALVRIDEVDAPADTVIVRAGDPLVGETVESLKIGPHGYAFNDLSQALYVADVTGMAATDTLIFLEPDDIVLAWEGTTAAPPPNSKLYGNMLGSPGARVDLNASGAVAFIAPVEGSCCDDDLLVPLRPLTTGCVPEPVDEVLVYNPDPSVSGSEVLVAEIGDELPAGSGNTICGFGQPVAVDDTGSILYTVKWNDPDDCPSALVRYADGQSAIVLEVGDEVEIDGVTSEIENLCGETQADEQRCYDVSPDGSVIGVRANLVDGREVAILLPI